MTGAAQEWRVRSFVPRRRKLSAARSARLEPLLARWSLPLNGPPLDLTAEFGTGGPFVLEIGFGAGEGLIALAEARPDECVIGVDVHTPGLGAVVVAIDDHDWANVRVVDGDVLELLERIPAASLDEIRILFPDPWTKRRHRPRRLVRPAVVARLVDRLRVGGVLHVATDIDDYAAQVEQVCADDGRLTGGRVDRPEWRPVTRYEQRGIEEGRTAVDLVFRRTG
jgi:tRNA (guanine-N7-)-methyltransferase